MSAALVGLDQERRQAITIGAVLELAAIVDGLRRAGPPMPGPQGPLSGANSRTKEVSSLGTTFH